MATYTIVDKDTDPLGPGEIPAGSTIEVNEGDVFIIDASVSDSIQFESASGSSTSFDIQIDDSNSNDFKIQIKDNLSVDIDIADDVDVADVDIDAKDADSVNLTAGDNVSLGQYDGSDGGVDTLEIGDDFTTTKDIKTGDGDDVITIGSGATIHDLDTEEGDDIVTIGDGLVAIDIRTGEGNDTLTIGDGAVLDDINTEEGDDVVTLGDDYTGDHVDTDDGDDTVIIGSGATINDLDGGNGQDSLTTETNFPDATNFESVVCFRKGTFILTKDGETPVESLQPGDMVFTLDNGMQPVRWIGSSVVVGSGTLAPVRISKGVFENERDLWVSQQHRILRTGWRTELLFGEKEALVPAKHLVDGNGIKIINVHSIEYVHILFDKHQIVLSNGIASESFHPGDVGMLTLSKRSREEVYSIFPALRADVGAYGQSARASLRSFEARMLAA